MLNRGVQIGDSGVGDEDVAGLEAVEVVGSGDDAGATRAARHAHDDTLPLAF